MRNRFGFSRTAFFAAVGALAITGSVRAADSDDDLRALVEKQSKQIATQSQQIESLKQRLDSFSGPGYGPQPLDIAPSQASSALLQTSTDQMMSAETTDQMPMPPNPAGDGVNPAPTVYKIGNSVAATASFKDGLFLWIDSPDQQFTMHLGAWMQFDNVLWNQSQALKTAPGARPGHAQGVASGIAAGGIGDLQDGEYFRRIRPFAEGTFYGNGEYRLIVALENDQFETTGLDEFWVGVNQIPCVGTIRVGHVKNAFGIEGDTTASSRAMTFMERSAYSESIELNQNFVTGIWWGNNYFDQRMTSQAIAFRTDQAAASGVFFGDGQWGMQARITGLPIYEDDGCELLHVAISGGWRTGSNNVATSRLLVDQLRARPELRDDDPAASPSGGEPLPNADSNRMIDTGVLAAGDDFLLGTEMLWIEGPFSLQAEYGWNFLNNVIGVAPSGSTLNPAITPAQDYVFSGGYVQVAYTLTGEHRAYDKKLGTMAREYYGKSGPNSNVLSHDPDGNIRWGIGAWEVAARYSYVDLNDGSGLNRIQGGIMDGVTLALNWYLNNNLNVMLDWVYDYRYAVPVGTAPGYVSGLGAEVQLQF